jgi:hypothetical protein
VSAPAVDPTQAALHRLEAERLRPSRDETPADPWRDLIRLLDELLSDPPPPDSRPEETP